MKIIKLDGITGIIIILILLLILILLALLSLPIIALVVGIILLYIIYLKTKNKIHKIIKDLKKKKIKIEDKSECGEIEIKLAKKIDIKSNDDKNNIKTNNDKNNLNNTKSNNKNNNNFNNENNNDNGINLVEIYGFETVEFINYLLANNFKIKDGILYYNNFKVYPIYKKTYPVNEIIKLYEKKPECDKIILGLKGEPSKPKFIYLIPIGESKGRMSIDELKQYEYKF